jgi:phosphate/sulfate permease
MFTLLCVKLTPAPRIPQAVNWRMMAWAMFGWLLTLPLAGLIAGLATAFGAAAPNFGPMYPMPN